MQSYVDEFIEASLSGTLDRSRYRPVFNSAQLYAFSNEVALTIARRFLDEKLSYVDADVVANDMYALYIGEAADIPEPADSVYLAFDRGEYAIGDENPVEAHTRPMLREILDEYKKAYR